MDYEYGRLTVERNSFHTLAVKYVNVDTLTVEIAPVPITLEARILQYNRWNQDDSSMARVLAKAVKRKIVVTGPRDRVRIFGLKLPISNAQRPGSSTLQVVRVASPRLDSAYRANMPLAIVQVTDLGVHARIGVSSGVVWVTGVNDGKPKAGAMLTVCGTSGPGKALDRTSAE